MERKRLDGDILPSEAITGAVFPFFKIKKVVLSEKMKYNGNVHPLNGEVVESWLLLLVLKLILNVYLYMPYAGSVEKWLCVSLRLSNYIFLCFDLD